MTDTQPQAVIPSLSLTIKQHIWRCMKGRLVTGDDGVVALGPKPVTGDEDSFSVTLADGTVMVISFLNVSFTQPTHRQPSPPEVSHEDT